MVATGGGLATAWVDAVVLVGGRAGAAEVSAADLVVRYAEPHRRYHTAEHVEAVLRNSAELAGALGLGHHERAVVALAACAHDVVYDARPGDDERASARWARAALHAAQVDRATAERVAGLVLTTLDHAAPAQDVAAVALLDADLAVLAAPPDRYAAYVRAVRAEYAAVDDAGWRAGRAAVLRALLDRPRLYLSEAGRHRFEAAARTNVAGELAQLTGAS